MENGKERKLSRAINGVAEKILIEREKCERALALSAILTCDIICNKIVIAFMIEKSLLEMSFEHFGSNNSDVLIQ
jgi:hypothetical protein